MMTFNFFFLYTMYMSVNYIVDIIENQDFVPYMELSLNQELPVQVVNSSSDSGQSC